MTSRNRLGETRLILIGAAVLLSLGMGIRQSFSLFLRRIPIAQHRPAEPASTFSCPCQARTPSVTRS
jgi:hypothetical protein